VDSIRLQEKEIKERRKRKEVKGNMERKGSDGKVIRAR
jgi:hypothetical protein